MTNFSDPGVSMVRFGLSRHSAPVASCRARYTGRSSSGGRDVLVAERVDSVPITAHGRTFTIHFVRKQRGGGESAIYSTNSDADMAARDQLIARTQAVLEKLPADVVQRMNSFSLGMNRSRPSGSAGLNTPFTVTSFTAVNTGNVAPVNIDYSPAQAEINTLLATLVPCERVRINALADRSRLAAAGDPDSASDSRRASRSGHGSSSHRSTRGRGRSRHLRRGRARHESDSASRSDHSGPFRNPLTRSREDTTAGLGLTSARPERKHREESESEAD
jgi:hypothetical protein